MRVKSTAITVLFVAWMAYLLSYLSRLTWSVLMPLARDDLGFSAAQAGSYASMFYVGYIAMQMPAGYLADRFGYRRVLLAAFLMIGPAVGLLSQVQRYEQGLALMIIEGMGAGAVFAAGVKAVTAWFDEKQGVSSLSWLQTGAPAGVLVANLMLPYIATHYGWRTATLTTAALSLSGFLVAMVLLRPRPKPEAALAATPTLTPDPTPDPAARSRPGEVFKHIVSRPNLRLLLLAGFLAQGAQTGFNTWAIAFFVDAKSLSIIQAGYMYVLVALAPFIWLPLQGRLGDRLGHDRKWLLMAAMFVLGAVMFSFSGLNGVALVVAFAIIGALAHGALPVLLSFMRNEVPTKDIGLSTGIFYAIWQTGAFLAPIVMGMVLDRTNEDFQPTFAVAAAAAVLCGIVVAGFRRPSEDRA